MDLIQWVSLADLHIISRAAVRVVRRRRRRPLTIRLRRPFSQPPAAAVASRRGSAVLRKLITQPV